MRITVRGGRSNVLSATYDLGSASFPRGRYGSPDSLWRRKLPVDVAVHPSSNLWRTTLCQQMGLNPSTGLPVVGATTGQCWMGGISGCYVVPADYPRLPVTLRAAHGIGTYADGGQELNAFLAQGVPIPPDWLPDDDSDKSVYIWQPSSDTMWELWGSENHPMYGIMAAWGGVMFRASQNPGVFQTLYDEDGVLWQHRSWGHTACSLPPFAGAIFPEEVEAGVIDHALAMVVGTAGLPWVIPAQRGDGESGKNYPPEGVRFRLPANVDVAAAKARFKPNVTLTAAQRAQALRFVELQVIAIRDRGVIVVDMTHGGCQLYMRDYGYISKTDPWSPLFPWYPMGLSPSCYARAIPWHLVQAVDPDFSAP